MIMYDIIKIIDYVDKIKNKGYDNVMDICTNSILKD